MKSFSAERAMLGALFPISIERNHAEISREISGDHPSANVPNLVRKLQRAGFVEHAAPAAGRRPAYFRMTAAGAKRLAALEGDPIAQDGPTPILASAISAAAAALRALLKSGLNREAIILLVAADSKLSKRNVGRVLDSLGALAENYTREKK